MSGGQVTARSVPAVAGRSWRIRLMRVQLDGKPFSPFTGFGRASSRPTKALHRSPRTVVRSAASRSRGAEPSRTSKAGGEGGAGELQTRSAPTG
jgi:hypothetical protein